MKREDDRVDRAQAPVSKWRALLDELETLGFRPTKLRGQNFLFDDGMLDAIASDAGLVATDHVLEVGPGCGVLTERLAARARSVFAVELDGRLADLTRRRTATFGNVEVLLADALDGKHALHPTIVEWSGRQSVWKLVANLPYSVGTPILIACSRLVCPPESMTVLLQSELVDRIAAQPGAAEWGGVSAKLQRRYDVRRLRRVGPQLFWPRPRVDSAVARLTLRERSVDPLELAQFDAWVTHLFAQRRKTLRSRLVDRGVTRPEAEALCAACGLDPTARPETLTVGQLVQLSKAAGPAG